MIRIFKLRLLIFFAKLHPNSKVSVSHYRNTLRIILSQIISIIHSYPIILVIKGLPYSSDCDDNHTKHVHCSQGVKG